MLQTSARLLRLLSLFQAQRYWSGADLSSGWMSRRGRFGAMSIACAAWDIRCIPHRVLPEATNWEPVRLCLRSCSTTMKPSPSPSDCALQRVEALPALRRPRCAHL